VYLLVIADLQMAGYDVALLMSALVGEQVSVAGVS
jgi:hypothetical protein